MVLAKIRHIDPDSYDHKATEVFKRPWNKVDTAACPYSLSDWARSIQDLRGRESDFALDLSGFALVRAPSREKSFTDDETIRQSYYPEVVKLLRETLSGVADIVIFDHTIRGVDNNAPRPPCELVHIDQTPFAAELRVRRHLLHTDISSRLQNRYQIVNVWRPIHHMASDMPLAVLDDRTLNPSDLVTVDILYPKSDILIPSDSRPSGLSTEGYEARGEQYVVVPQERHEFFYVKDMEPDEALLIKCFDSESRLMKPHSKIAHAGAHSAFKDPETPSNAPTRHSIEVRCLVFYEANAT